MSFTAVTAPAFRLGEQILRAPSITKMARTVGIIGAAGALGAIYHVAGAELQRSIEAIRVRNGLRNQRHEAIRVHALTVPLSPAVQRKLVGARDSYRTAWTIIEDEDTSEADRVAVTSVVLRATNTRAD